MICVLAIYGPGVPRESRSTFARVTSCCHDANGKLHRAVTDRGHPRLRIARRLEAFNPRQHRSEHRIGFKLSERSADAHMDACTPADLTAKLATDVETVGVGPLPRIAVRCREQQSAACAGWNDV